MTAPEIWGGVECTVNRVHDRFFDQVVRSGHQHRLDDLDRFAALGMRALRYPVLWERHAPRALDEISWEWSDERLARMRALGVRPIVGLVHHGSGPAYTSLLDDRFPELLGRYAAAVAERYPWVDEWTPVNEPLTTARFSGLYGHWYPHRHRDAAFVRALLNQLRGVALAMRAIRKVNPNARLVQTEDIGESSGTPRLGRQLEHERHRRWLTWDLLTGRVDTAHPLRRFLLGAGASEAEVEWFRESPCPPDVIGVNYYLTSDRWLDHRIDMYPPWSHGGNGRLRYADVEAVRVRPEGIHGHHHHLMATWQRYQLPLAITEVHLGCTREEQMRWVHAAWSGACRARNEGADVRAVTAWALLGSYDWDSLVTRDAGHYEPGVFDVRAAAPRPTAIAGFVRQLAAGETASHPVIRGNGWWARPRRITMGPAAPAARHAHDERDPVAAPLLIVGAGGTLGRAFARICASRGLAVHLAGRADADFAERTQVDQLFARVHPWAVINAAGFVRVDAAESEPGACWRDNVGVPVALASACRDRDIPLVTFSSDLVFDGALGQPYGEQAAPAPLNVYGATKAEAERRVLDLLPRALVVRTSAFFGPWDEANFATALLRSAASGQTFSAPDDYVISPTYVPDLVNATLDLLIDGESGLWHLANEGALTWFEFGRSVARRLSVAEALVAPCRTADMWGPANRPSYSVLASTRGQVMRPLEEAIEAYAAAVEATAVRRDTNVA